MKLLATTLILLATSTALAQTDATFENAESAQQASDPSEGKKPLVSGRISPVDPAGDEFEFTRSSKAISKTEVCKETLDGLSCDRVNTHTVYGIRRFPISFTATSKY